MPELVYGLGEFDQICSILRMAWELSIYSEREDGVDLSTILQLDLRKLLCLTSHYRLMLEERANASPYFLLSIFDKSADGRSFSLSLFLFTSDPVQGTEDLCFIQCFCRCFIQFSVTIQVRSP